MFCLSEYGILILERMTFMKVGIIGTGDISHEFIDAAKHVKQLQVIGVTQRNLEKAQFFADQYQLEIATDNLGDLLQSVDIIYCGLPNSLHYEIAKQVITQKKHIIIEKPITSNTKELKHLIELSKEHDVLIFEASRVSTLPHFNLIEDLLEDEQDEIFININFCKQSRKYFAYLAGQNPNTFTTKYSGGALYDLGVYGVHFAVALLGKPQQIHFSAYKLNTGTDGFSSLILEYPKGLVTINSSKMTHGDSNFTIQGLKKKIVSHFSVSTIDSFEVIENHETSTINNQNQENMVYYLEELYRIISTQDIKTYEKQLSNSLIVQEILEAARKQVGIVFKND